VLSAFCATKPLSTAVYSGGTTVYSGGTMVYSGGTMVYSGGTTVYSDGTTVYNGGSTNGCTVRFVYRIFEYLFIFGIFNSLRFRIFILALESLPPHDHKSARSQKFQMWCFIVTTKSSMGKKKYNCLL